MTGDSTARNWSSMARGLGCNCFWLLAPILILNLLFTPRLPPAYQMDIFWRDIPRAIGLPENVLRGLIMLLPLLMALRLSTPRQRLGLVVYLVGLLLYATAWAILIVAPRSAWSTGAIGFAAPAWTPAVWLTGIGLIGDGLTVGKVPLRPWIYWGLSALFLVFHNLHALLVFGRGV